MSQKKDLKIFIRTIAGILILLLVFFILALTTGSVKIPLSEVFSPGNSIVYEIRLPRALLSMIIGGALSVSGFLLQTYFKNPIAGPFVLGISSGAKMLVAILLLTSVVYDFSITSLGMIGAAFIGSMLVIFFLVIIAKHIDGMGALLVAGVMTGYICNAVCDVLVTFFSDNDVVNLRNWSKGSFSGADISSVRISFVIVFVCFLVVLCLSKPIEAIMLSESYAFTMGVNVKRLRLFIVVISGILSATAAAFAGPISFVGVAVPFLSTKLLKNTKPLYVIPTCFALGALVCLVCDLVARTVFAPTELNISTVTAILGAPVVIFMIVTNRRR
ncbi:MAG: iron ABC transporter permease [Lachnospiraceae bacterium]|uniref:Iron ABC transporter permease n=1 Tax=Candidatus Weimeria bifida TaxID=2599074 RepID=A0A6N7IYR6_9FIRM|nr:iron ABC transporter permease [Candidatus Weimeria bifida]RRF97195.1 MAG: iron ABC transporter permease [Lachnospiraceae bacterium]